MAGPTKRRRVVGGGGRRTVAPARKDTHETALDDRPLSILASRDGKWLAVALPWDVWILDARSLAFQRSIELTVEAPSVAEGSDGTLWIGGQHLRKASAFTARSQKVGTKLGGYVDHVAMLRPDLLCGVGAQGEILWDVEREAPNHKRKASHGDAVWVVATADERAVFIDGSEQAWIIDPNHPSGYTKLRMRETSESSVEAEGLVAVGLSSRGRCIFAARDGAVAWTAANLRLAAERHPKVPKSAKTPLSIAADERWLYVLRPGGLLQRLLIEQPDAVRKQEERRARERERGRSGRRGPRRDAPRGQEEDEVEPLPEAQECRLEKAASCMALVASPEAGASRLVFGGSKADGHLGRIWAAEPERLTWSELSLGRRALVEPAPDSGAAGPNFVATKSKIEGPAISTLSVDDVISRRVQYWLTRGQGSLLERPTRPGTEAEALPGDAVLLPAMLRFREGTARPGLFLWPGVARDDREPPAPTWLTWGDEPRQWIPLDTPHIREQRWARSDVFPMHIALPAMPPGLPGNRVVVPRRWVSADLFSAMVEECKHQLKVLW